MLTLLAVMSFLAIYKLNGIKFSCYDTNYLFDISERSLKKINKYFKKLEKNKLKKLELI